MAYVLSFYCNLGSIQKRSNAQSPVTPPATIYNACILSLLLPLSYNVSLKGRDGQPVKLAAHAVDVDEGERARVRAIGEQDKGALAPGINPAACARKTSVAEAVWRQRSPGSRAFGRGQLPCERARFL